MSSNPKVKLAVAMPVEGPPETARVHLGPQLQLRQLGNVVRLDSTFTGSEGQTMGPIVTGNVDVSRARDAASRGCSSMTCQTARTSYGGTRTCS